MSSTPEQLEMAAALLGDAMAAADDDDDTRFSLVHAALFAVAEHTREEKGLTELAAQSEWVRDTTGGLRWILGAARLRLLMGAFWQGEKIEWRKSERAARDALELIEAFMEGSSP